MHHERVYADAGGIAERKIKKKHDIGDDAIKSTKEGECKRWSFYLRTGESM